MNWMSFDYRAGDRVRSLQSGQVLVVIDVWDRDLLVQDADGAQAWVADVDVVAVVRD